MLARAYQTEVLDLASETNAIVLLPTGAGKTLIAVELIKRQSRALTPGGTIAVFIAPTKLNTRTLLLAQTLNTVCFEEGEVGDYTSDDGLDFWSEGEWLATLGRHRLIVLTPQIMLDLLRHGFLTLGARVKNSQQEIEPPSGGLATPSSMEGAVLTEERGGEDACDAGGSSKAVVRLMIFDECHHATKNGPMHCIMREFYRPLLRNRYKCSETMEKTAPHVLGLTACPVNSMVRSPGKGIEELEHNLCAKVVTVVAESAELHAWVSRPEVTCVHYQHSLFVHSACSTSACNIAEAFSCSLKELGLWGACTALLQMLNPKATSNNSTESFQPTLAVGDFVVRPAERVQTAARGEVETTFPLLRDEFITVCERMLSAERVDALRERVRQGLQDGQSNCSSTSGNTMHELVSHVKNLPTSAEMLPAPTAVGCTGRSTVWVSDKVSRLRDVLLDCWRDARVTGGAMGHWRTIIFVERKSTAHAIAALLAELPGLDFLAVGVQMGYSMCDKGIARASQRTLDDFRRGLVNTVVSTSVLEEGVDVPACNLVVMFDLGKNIRAYIQQRGRARHLGSKLFIFIPEGEKDTYDNQLEHYGIYEAGMTASAKQATRTHASRLVSQEVSSIDWGVSGTGEMNDGLEYVYCIQSTGATLTPESAVVTLSRYCNKIPTDAYTSASEAQFMVTETKDGRYISDVFIPGHPWFAKATSGPCASKRESKKLAAYAAVIELHQKGELSDRLLSRMREDEHDIFGDEMMTEECPAFSTHTSSEDQFPGSASKTKRPDVYMAGLTYRDILFMQNDCSESSLFDTKVMYAHFDLYAFEHQGEVSSDFFRVGLLASKRMALPTDGELPPIVLHHVVAQRNLHGQSAVNKSEELNLVDSDSHETSSADFTPRSTGYTVKKAQGDWACIRESQHFLDNHPWASNIVDFDRWMRRHAYGVAAPLSDEELIDPPFIMVPVRTACAHSAPPAEDTTCKTWEIDWPVLSDHANAWNGPSFTDKPQGYDEMEMVDTGVSSSTLAGGSLQREARVVTTRHGGHVRWYKTLTGNSTITPRAPIEFKMKTADGTDRMQSFAEYYFEKYGLKVSLDLQMVTATLESHGHPKSMLKNYSQRKHETEDLHHKKAEQLVLLPVDICSSMCPASIWQDVMKLPSMLHRMKSQLLALELSQHLIRRGWIEEPSSASSVPALVKVLLEAITADSCQEDLSYERLETLGDSFLKYASSASLFIQHPGWHEGQLTCARSHLVSNDHLLVAAEASGLLPYLRHTRFQPQGVFRGAQQGTSATADHVDESFERLKPKARADLVEALIGAAFVHGGERASFRMSHFLLQENRAFPMWGIRRILPKFIDTQNAANRAHLVDSSQARGLPCHMDDVDDDQEISSLEDNVLRRRMTGSVPAVGLPGARQGLLKEALTHRSWCESNPFRSSTSGTGGGGIVPCYQRLEFLGDAALDFVITTRHLWCSSVSSDDFTHFTVPYSPGELTVKRSSLVSNARLAVVCAKMGLPKFFRHDSATLHADVSGYYFASDVVSAPKVMGDLVESVIGAVLLDCEFDLDIVWKIMSRHLLS